MLQRGWARRPVGVWLFHLWTRHRSAVSKYSSNRGQWRCWKLVLGSCLGVEHWLYARQKTGAQLRNPASSRRPLQMDSRGLYMCSPVSSAWLQISHRLGYWQSFCGEDWLGIVRTLLPWTKSQTKNWTVIRWLHSLLSLLKCYCTTTVIVALLVGHSIKFRLHNCALNPHQSV